MKHYVGYIGPSKASLLSEVMVQPTWVICPTDTAAAQLFEDLKFFFKFHDISAPIHYFPFRHSDLHPHQIREDYIALKRIATLYACISKQCHLITSVQALAQITLSKEQLTNKTFSLMVETEFPQSQLLEQIIEAGYERAGQCTEKGLFSLRGDILDIFPPNQSNPLRLEFFGDELQTIRYFDTETQRTLEHKDHKRLEYIEIMPTREIFYPPNPDRIIEKIKIHADHLGIAPPERREIQEAIAQKSDFAAMPKFFPFFYDTHTCLRDYYNDAFHLVWIDPFTCKQTLQTMYKNIADETLAQQTQKIISAPPADFFIKLDTLESYLDKHATLLVSDVHVQDQKSHSIEHTQNIKTLEDLRSKLAQNKKSSDPLGPLFKEIIGWHHQGLHVYFVFYDQKGATNFKKILTARQLSPDDHKNISVITGDLSAGFIDHHHNRVWISEVELFGAKKHYKNSVTKKTTTTIDLRQLELDDPIVHIDFGIGIYKGLKKISVGNSEQEFVTIEYAKKDKLFLPIHRLNCIHPFIKGEGGKPKIDTLGSSNWSQNKAKAKKAVVEMANELIELYAKRKVAQGFAYSPPDEMYYQFENLFPFEETADQQKTLEDIEGDLHSDKPMDRLVCGDVGFGKTEIALRTAFRVAAEGKQVAVLVPTTILCQQHYETFKKRFEPFPMEVDFVSRFKTAQQNRETIKKLSQGKIDIIIGTHRLLSKDVHFANIGLLVLDEEHRFGVGHKERIKTFRNKIDVLTLTATPIPRTLQLSMTGIRDLSLINTPPLNRKAVHTILSSFDENTIKDAVYREVQRGGQVYFLHNRVESIATMKLFLQKLMPDIRIKVGHGQMDKNELEKTMIDFLQGEYDLLLSTTIIESGIDVPNANTLIINRADTFGLAQLYQLRGRVGRSSRDAYAYLLIPGEDMITPLALKRLQTIKKFTELGAGLKIAMHDLEMRGAGNMLGAKQSGHISSVGFELYIQLLEREIRKLKGEKVVVDIEPELKVSLPASIPETYIADHHERLLFYRRLSSCPNNEELDALHSELVDRFGKLPHVTKNLIDLIDLKILCRQAGVKTLSINAQEPVIEFSDQANIDMDKLIAMIQKDKYFQLTPDQKLRISFAPEIEPYSETKKILQRLSVHGKNSL
ncbi:MAG: transcription-repair coupling factor [Bdellovibrionota bacterium]